MDVYEAIAKRRSIRKYKDKPVSRDLVARLLDAAIKAPSGSNRQPWRFVVLEGARKDRLVEIFAAEVQRLREADRDIGSAAESARIMAQAPVAILVYDPLWTPDEDHGGDNRHRALVDTQSVGAAIQNLLLAATAEGLGSLWIADIFVAERQVAEWLGRRDELVAAVSIGWPDQSPAARPRKARDEVTEWIS
ncbi:MAG: nitroreductase family protein [Bacillota bacterium]